MLEGCLELAEAGLNPPASMREDMTQYRKNQDTIGRFVDDEVILGEEVYVSQAHHLPRLQALGGRSGRALHPYLVRVY